MTIGPGGTSPGGASWLAIGFVSSEDRGPVNGQRQRVVVEPGERRSGPLSGMRWRWLAGFAALNALAAWAGAVALVTGGTDFGEPTNDRLPFDSLEIAGLALATIVAIPLTVLAWCAVLVAAGVGLGPHLTKNGLAVMSVVSVIVLIAGLGIVVVGARSTLRDRHPLAKLAGGAATVVVVAVAVSIIAPGVAANIVPSTDVTSTPAALGLDYESVTLTSTDGVELAA